MISPFVRQIIGALVRVLVVWAAGYLAAHAGITLTEDQIGQTVTYLVPVVGILAWSVYAKYGDRLKLLTAASEAGMSERQIESLVKSPDVPTPPVNTPKDERP